MDLDEEELRKNDILFQIDMQLYVEFNDKLCEMNDHIGDIYSLRELEELEKIEKEKERELLRKAVKQLQEENETLKNKLKEIEAIVDTTPYVAYTDYHDILYESDEILKIIRGE